MPTRLLSLLLLFAATVIFHGAERGLDNSEGGAIFASVEGVANSQPLPASRLEGTLGQRSHTAPANDNPPRQPESQYESRLLAPDLFVSSSEKFDSSFCESMVLHLVAKTTGKLQLEDLVNKAPRSPSLLRMNVMLQV